MVVFDSHKTMVCNRTAAGFAQTEIMIGEVAKIISENSVNIEANQQ
jgi:hypothetical protein